MPIDAGRRNEPYVYYGSDEGVGRMKLINEDLSIYMTVQGSVIQLRLVSGPLVEIPCA